MVEENNVKNVTLVKIEENADESVQSPLIIDAELPSKLILGLRIKWAIFVFCVFRILRNEVIYFHLAELG